MTHRLKSTKRNNKDLLMSKCESGLVSASSQLLFVYLLHSEAFCLLGDNLWVTRRVRKIKKKQLWFAYWARMISVVSLDNRGVVILLFLWSKSGDSVFLWLIEFLSQAKKSSVLLLLFWRSFFKWLWFFSKQKKPNLEFFSHFAFSIISINIKLKCKVFF